MKKTLLLISSIVGFTTNAQIITTFAGNGTGSFSGDGGNVTAAELWIPYGIAFDGTGNLYIDDAHNNRIRKVNSSGIITTVAGNGMAGSNGNGGQATAAEIGNPTGIAFDDSGNLYICDYSGFSIRKVNTSGIITTVAGVTYTPPYYGHSVTLTASATAYTPCPVGSCTLVTNDNFNYPYIYDDSAAAAGSNAQAVYFNPFLIGAAGNDTVPCWQMGWGTPQVILTDGISAALMGSIYMNANDGCAAPNNGFPVLNVSASQSECIFRQFPPTALNQANTIYVFKYSYRASNSNGLDGVEIGLASSASSGLPNFTTTYPTSGFLAGFAAIDDAPTVPAGNESWNTRTACFTGQAADTYDELVIYPKTLSSIAGACVEQGLYITDISITAITPTATSSAYTICPGQTVTLGVSSCGALPSGMSYNWSGALGISCAGCLNPTVSPTVTTTYFVTMFYTGSNAAATCNLTSSVTVYVDPTPAFTLTTTTPNPICSGNNSVIYSNGTSNIISYSIFPAATHTVMLTGGSANFTVTPNIGTTTYTVTSLNAAGCTVTNTISITVEQSPLIPTFSGVSCTDQTLTVTNSNPSYTYVWTPSVSCISPNCSEVVASHSGSYVVTATSSINSCTSHTTIAVDLSPTLTVTPTFTNICQGSSVTLNAATSYPTLTNVVWSPASSLSCSGAFPPCLHPTATPTVTTNYTITATNHNTGCAISSIVTVSVSPSPTITISDNPVPVICTQESGTFVQLNATSTAGTYSWIPSTGLNNTTVANPIATPTATTVYTVTSTGTDGCVAKDTVTVFVENCVCGGAANHPYAASTMNFQPPYIINSFNSNIAITSNITLTNRVFIFAPNIQLTVQAGNTLTLKHCHFYACTDMWQGIIVEPGASLVVEDSSMIEDALTAISCNNWLQPATSNSLTVNGCVFNRNDTAIAITNYTYTAANFPATIENAVFTSRTLPSTQSGGGWSSPATPHYLKSTQAYSNILETPYNLAHVAAYTPELMKAPRNSYYSVYGIYLSNVGNYATTATSYSNIPSTQITYYDITIGSSTGATTATNNSHINLFDGLYYGIYAVSANFTCINNAFELLQIDCGFLTAVGIKCLLPNSGTAIYATNTFVAPNYNQFNRARVIYPAYNAYVNPNTSNTYAFTPNFNNKFYDCVEAIDINNYTNTDIAGTDMRSSKTAPSLFGAGLYGASVSSPVYQYNFLRYNVITNINTGIYFTAANISSHEQLGAVHADHNTISADFINPPTTQGVNTAIAIDNSIAAITCYSVTPGNCGQSSYSQVTANQNNLNYVNNGIEMSNWVSQKGLLVAADTNYIMLNLESPATNTQFGINANHCYTHQITNNNINGTTTTDTLMRGVLCNDDAISLVTCNSTG